ncbi:Uncharacterized protein APZ42_007446, partial [Daphnia magna]
ATLVRCSLCNSLITISAVLKCCQWRSYYASAVPSQTRHCPSSHYRPAGHLSGRLLLAIDAVHFR